MTDIVVTTCDRISYLKTTLEGIWDRTRTHNQLMVIDDGSDRETQQYLLGQCERGAIHGLLLRPIGRGIPANLIDAYRLTESDPYVISDDDVLCPDLDPDWLARGLETMDQYPNLGLMALNEVGSTRDKRRAELSEQLCPGVTLCKHVGGQFLFVRRAVIADVAEKTLAGQSPVKHLAHDVIQRGWQVGYLTDVYCYHFGVFSARMGQDISAYVTEPANMVTLEPVR